MALNLDSTGLETGVEYKPKSKKFGALAGDLAIGYADTLAGGFGFSNAINEKHYKTKQGQTKINEAAAVGGGLVNSGLAMGLNVMAPGAGTAFQAGTQAAGAAWNPQANENFNYDQEYGQGMAMGNAMGALMGNLMVPQARYGGNIPSLARPQMMSEGGRVPTEEQTYRGGTLPEVEVTGTATGRGRHVVDYEKKNPYRPYKSDNTFINRYQPEKLAALEAEHRKHWETQRNNYVDSMEIADRDLDKLWEREQAAKSGEDASMFRGVKPRSAKAEKKAIAERARLREEWANKPMEEKAAYFGAEAALVLAPELRGLKGVRGAAKPLTKKAVEKGTAKGVQELTQAGFDGNLLTRPLTPITDAIHGSDFTAGKHWYRKIGGKKGLEDLIKRQGAGAPKAYRTKSGGSVNSPAFGIGNKPNENYGGIFAVELNYGKSNSVKRLTNQAGGSEHYGSFPLDETNRLMEKIPLGDEGLKVFRKRFLSNTYKEIDKTKLAKELKSANFQEYSEKLFKYGVRGFIAHEILAETNPETFDKWTPQVRAVLEEGLQELVGEKESQAKPQEEPAPTQTLMRELTPKMALGGNLPQYALGGDPPGRDPKLVSTTREDVGMTPYEQAAQGNLQGNLLLGQTNGDPYRNGRAERPEPLFPGGEGWKPTYRDGNVVLNGQNKQDMAFYKYYTDLYNTRESFENDFKEKSGYTKDTFLEQRKQAGLPDYLPKEEMDSLMGEGQYDSLLGVNQGLNAAQSYLGGGTKDFAGIHEKDIDGVKDVKSTKVGTKNVFNNEAIKNPGELIVENYENPPTTKPTPWAAKHMATYGSAQDSIAARSAPQMAGGGKVPPYHTSDPNDPRIQQYNDSLDLYKAYKYQSDLVGEKKHSEEYTEFFLEKDAAYKKYLKQGKSAQESVVLGNEDIRKKYNLPKYAKRAIDVSATEKDKKVHNYIKSLGNTNLHSTGDDNAYSTDAFHKTISPVGIYEGVTNPLPNSGIFGNTPSYGGSINHVYKKPEQEVIVDSTPSVQKTSQSKASVKDNRKGSLDKMEAKGAQVPSESTTPELAERKGFKPVKHSKYVLEQLKQNPKGANPGDYEIYKQNFAEGGNTMNAQYEAEGGEMVQGYGTQNMNGKMQNKASDVNYLEGPKHESGGIPMKGGERVFSNKKILAPLGIKQTPSELAKKPSALKGKAEKMLDTKRNDKITIETAKKNIEAADKQLDAIYAMQEMIKGNDPQGNSMQQAAPNPMEGAPMPPQGMEQMGAPQGQPMPQEGMPMAAYGGSVGDFGALPRFDGGGDIYDRLAGMSRADRTSTIAKAGSSGKLFGEAFGMDAMETFELMTDPDAAKAMQERLKAAGRYEGAVDGDFGKKSWEAYKAHNAVGPDKLASRSVGTIPTGDMGEAKLATHRPQAQTQEQTNAMLGIETPERKPWISPENIDKLGNAANTAAQMAPIAYNLFMGSRDAEKIKGSDYYNPHAEEAMNNMEGRRVDRQRAMELADSQSHASRSAYIDASGGNSASALAALTANERMNSGTKADINMKADSLEDAMTAQNEQMRLGIGSQKVAADQFAYGENTAAEGARQAHTSTAMTQLGQVGGMNQYNKNQMAMSVLGTQGMLAMNPDVSADPEMYRRALNGTLNSYLSGNPNVFRRTRAGKDDYTPRVDSV